MRSVAVNHHLLFFIHPSSSPPLPLSFFRLPSVPSSPRWYVAFQQLDVTSANFTGLVHSHWSYQRGSRKLFSVKQLYSPCVHHLLSIKQQTDTVRNKPVSCTGRVRSWGTRYLSWKLGTKQSRGQEEHQSPTKVWPQKGHHQSFTPHRYQPVLKG